jgi:lycopene beta-cyclase
MGPDEQLRGGPDCDIVIAGGGLAGLSLAAQLARMPSPGRRVVVVDDGRQPIEDRAWAFWSEHPGLLDADAARSWSRVAVHATGTALHLPLRDYRYRLVTGTTLAAAARRLAAGRGGFSMITAHVDRIVDGPGGATVLTDGPELGARWVFDSVSPAPLSPVLTLSFLGWRVRCRQPAFDPHEITLFDFRVPQDGAARFVYLLPTSPFEALVEHTSLLPADRVPATADATAGWLGEYLERVAKAPGYRILHVESGVLQLGEPAEVPAARHVVPIGITGGLVKPSTGYAYSRIQRHSAAIARSLAELGHPFGVPGARRRFRYLDRVFLEAVRAEPDLLPVAFAALFQANPADRVLRFLDEQSSAADDARIIASMPRAPFLAAAQRVRRRHGRP